MKKLIVDIKSGDNVLMSLDKELSFVSFGDLDRGDISDTTNWGCYSNVGEIEFFDKNNNFINIVSQNPSLFFCIYYKSSLSSAKKLLYTFKIDDYEKNDETKIVSVKLKDEIADWQDESVGEYYKFYPKTLYDVFNETLGNDIEPTDSVLSKMNKTTIGVSYMQESNKWRRAENFCQASMSRVFCSPDGVPIISDEETSKTDTIIIQPKNILSIGVKSKNKKENHHINQKNYTSHLYEPCLILENGIDFNWFSVTGTTSTIIGDGLTQENLTHRTIVAKWQNDNGTSLVKYPAGQPIYSYKGARFFTNSKIVNRVFDAYPKSIINKSSNRDGLGYLIKDEKISINESDDKQNFSVSINKKENNAEILFEYYDVFDDTRIDRVDHGYVGKHIVTGGNLNLFGAYFSEDGEEVIGENKSKELRSNELIQKNSLFEKTNLASHIVEYSNGKYSNGVECVVMEVTPSKYYSSKNGLIIDPNSSTPLFQKYDVVVPYVVRNGYVKPYSNTTNGHPKEFKIIGIQYYYKGFLRQKLYLQENVHEDTKEPVSVKEPSGIACSTNDKKNTVFLWEFTGLGSNQEYTIFWSINNSLFSEETVFKEINRYTFFVLNEGTGTITKYAISKNINDCAIFNAQVKSDENGALYIGIFSKNNITENEMGVFSDIIKENTKYIYLSKK